MYYTNLMPFGPIIVIFLRVVLPPIWIKKNPLWGTVASSFLDAADVIIITLLGLGNFAPGQYHTIDKILDLFFLSISFLTVFSWKNNLAKRTAMFLFTWRVIGVIIFELSQIRPLLLIFNNLFQEFFIFWLGYIYFKKKEFFRPTEYKKLVLILVLLIFFKLPQEYILHYAQVQPWIWFQTNVLHTLP